MNTSEESHVTLPAILYFIDNEYRSIHSNVLDEIEGFNSSALRIATKNKVMYYLCKRILEERPDLVSDEIIAGIKQGEKSIAKVKSTLEFLRSLFTEEELDFLVIKTYKGLPYRTLDIDLIVRDEDFTSLISALESRGAVKTDGRFLDMLTKLRVALPGYQINGLMKIDIYKGIIWWLPVLDEEFMWKKPRLIDFYGIKCPIPSREADLLSLLASSLFTDRKITLLDFLYIKSLLSSELDFPTLLGETRKCGWGDQYLRVISLIHEIERKIYNSATIPKCIRFPYTLPWGILNSALPGVITKKVAKKPTSFPSTLVNILFHFFIGEIYTWTETR